MTQMEHCLKCNTGFTVEEALALGKTAVKRPTYGENHVLDQGSDAPLEGGEDEEAGNN